MIWHFTSIKCSVITSRVMFSVITSAVKVAVFLNMVYNGSGLFLDLVLCYMKRYLLT